jgi:hypothetical protein
MSPRKGERLSECLLSPFLFELNSYAANEVQRVFRGLMGRKKSKGEASRKKTTRQLYYINYLCIQLQRCFRGFWSRKYKRDHSKRKQYCRSLKAKIKEIIEKMNQYQFEQTQREAEESEKKKTEEFRNLAQNLHHLISTRHIRGVYNPVQYFVAVSLCVYFLKFTFYYDFCFK